MDSWGYFLVIQLVKKKRYKKFQTYLSNLK